MISSSLVSKVMRTCKSGHVLRKGYTRKGYTRKTGTHVSASRVPAACIPDVGASGKGFKGPGKGIGKLRKGDLSQFGYSPGKSTRSRHIALNAATRKYGALSVFRKLNALATYTKRTSPSTSRRALSDRSFLQKKL